MVTLPDVLMVIVVVAGGVLIDKIISIGRVSTTVGRKIAQCSGNMIFVRVFNVDFPIRMVIVAGRKGMLTPLIHLVLPLSRPGLAIIKLVSILERVLASSF
jgi:hypothetical protein